MKRYLIPLLVFLVAGAIGVFTSWAAYYSATLAEQTRFETMSNDLASSVQARLGQHISLLHATRSFFSALGGPANGEAFDEFVQGLDLDGLNDGVQGLGFALRIDTGQEADAVQVIARNYDLERDVWPETDQSQRTPIILLSPQNFRNQEALGYDMFSETVRRVAMRESLTKSEPQATAPVELVQEVTSDKQAGFLIFLPYYQTVQSEASGPEGTFVSGFVYAPFRAEDLFDAALSNSRRLPVVVEVFDVTDGEPLPLFLTADSAQLAKQSEFKSSLHLNVAGRLWRMDVFSTPLFKRSGARDLALVLGAVSLLLAIALGVSANAQLKAARTALKLHAVSARNLQDKELMLQEMKHRIKNSITRMLAMARQTANHSENLEEFTKTFSSRMQAMATAQDMLTRSHWQRADLRQLLTRELEQVMDSGDESQDISGPEVELDERAVQALGLIFHELATNALKYGDYTNGAMKLTVHWSVTGRRADKTLRITWHEQGNLSVASSSTGFGTRLIDASVKSELGGTIERIHGPVGFKVLITIPSKLFDLSPAGKGRKDKVVADARQNA